MSRVTQYVMLLNDCLFSMYNSITCVLRTFNVKRTYACVLRGTDTVRHTVRTTRGLSPVLLVQLYVRTYVSMALRAALKNRSKGELYSSKLYTTDPTM